MTRYAARTRVSEGDSRNEIEKIVRRYGADGFVAGWEGDRARVRFRCADRHVRFVMDVPASEQARRSIWRALALLVKAKLEAVESKIVTFEEEFLGHVVMPDGRTVYEAARETVHLAYSGGKIGGIPPAYRSDE